MPLEFHAGNLFRGRTSLMADSEVLQCVAHDFFGKPDVFHGTERVKQ